MTILEFARLCSTSTQTLRYYDRIGLLKPSRVDNWTGYRYYEKEQAQDFFKIKNLQLADFSIAEIQSLVHQPDACIYKAFDAKIAAEKEKLAQILTIQASYRKEAMTIEAKITAISAFLRGELPRDTLKQQFPELDPDEIWQWDRDLKAFRPEEYELLREWKGFRSFREVVTQIPKLDGHRRYALIAGTPDRDGKCELIQLLLNAVAGSLVHTDEDILHDQLMIFVVDAPEDSLSLKLLQKS